MIEQFFCADYQYHILWIDIENFRGESILICLIKLPLGFLDSFNM